MSEKDIFEGLQGVIIGLKNIGLGFAGFLASCFYKGAKGVEISNKKELMRFGLFLCISTIIGSILNIMGIIDINKTGIIHFVIGAFGIKFMEMLEKKFEKLFDKVKIGQ